MSGIYIPDIEVPTKCPCRLIGSGYDVWCFAAYGIPARVKEYDECCENGTKASWCPILPAADVAPVVHAHWEIKTKWIPLAFYADPLDWDRYDEENHAEEEDYYACSRCGYDDGYWYPKDNYCPNCGAKMDEGASNA